MTETDACGYEVDDDGELVARDPRDMSVVELGELGHKRMSPLKALRARCIDCCAGSRHEVRLCTAVTCPAWPFRMGANPYRTKRELSEEERSELRQRLATARDGRPIPQGGEQQLGSKGT
jgi:hypothetical protein